MGRDGRSGAGPLDGTGRETDTSRRVRGYTKLSLQQLVDASAKAAEYITVFFRMYGVYNVVFGLTASLIAITAFRRGERWAWWALLLGNTIALVSAQIYDRTVNAIGPFEVTEYLGLALVWLALDLTARAPKPRPRNVETSRLATS